METQLMETGVAEQTDSAEARAKEMIAERLDKLRLPQLQQVLTFSNFVLSETERAEQRETADIAPKGTVEDLLALAGSWQFEPGEFEEIMADIEQGRLLELEKDDILLD